MFKINIQILEIKVRIMNKTNIEINISYSDLGRYL